MLAAYHWDFLVRLQAITFYHYVHCMLLVFKIFSNDIMFHFAITYFIIIIIIIFVPSVSRIPRDLEKKLI